MVLPLLRTMQKPQMLDFSCSSEPITLFLAFIPHNYVTPQLCRGPWRTYFFLLLEVARSDIARMFPESCAHSALGRSNGQWLLSAVETHAG